MKKRFFILLTVIISGFSSIAYSQNLICKLTKFNCNNIKYHNLIIRNGIYFEKFKDTPFTGVVNGQKQGQLENGIKNGLWKEYNESGDLSSKGEYKNGFKENNWVYYYSSGLVSAKGSYKKGLRQGHWVELDKYGFNSIYHLLKNTNKDVFKQGTGEYVNGYKVDANGKKIIYSKPIKYDLLFKNYKRIDNIVVHKKTLVPFTGRYIVPMDKNWRSTYIHSMKNGISDGVHLGFLDGHLRREVTYYNGEDKVEGSHRLYWKDNNLRERKFYKSGKLHGLVVSFFSNGQLEMKVDYVNGKEQGEYLEYHKNGQLKTRVFYKDGKVNGIYEAFDDKGNLTISETYKDDKLVK